MLTSSWARRPLAGYIAAVCATALLTAALTPLRDDIGLLNEGLLFLLLSVLLAAGWGRNVGLFSALITNLSLNYFFVHPLHTFTVNDPENVVALIVFLVVSAVTGSLLSASRGAAAEARRRQAETEVALALSHAMSGQTEPDEALAELCRETVSAFAAPGAAVLAGSDGQWAVLAHAGWDAAARSPDAVERAAADRAVAEGSLQSLGRSGLARTRARVVFPAGRRAALASDRSVALLPLRIGQRVLGVLRLDGPIGETPFRDAPEQLLGAVASEAALAVQRAELAKAASHAEALREADELKSALMASISHDLKTPLAGIKAAISSLRDKRIRWSKEDVDAFQRAIDSQADRLNRVISDILDMNRIESGALTPEKVEVNAAEILERARDETRMETAGRDVTVEAAGEFTVCVDEALIVQAVVNLIENAAKYATPGTAIHLQARRGEDERALITVADEGPGIAPADLPHVFERFYRAEGPSRRVRGSGLGLTIVKGFVELCGGEVSVDSTPGGTSFLISLPLAETKETARV